MAVNSDAPDVAEAPNTIKQPVTKDADTPGVFYSPNLNVS